MPGQPFRPTTVATATRATHPRTAPGRLQKPLGQSERRGGTQEHWAERNVNNLLLPNLCRVKTLTRLTAEQARSADLIKIVS